MMSTGTRISLIFFMRIMLVLRMPGAVIRKTQKMSIASALLDSRGHGILGETILIPSTTLWSVLGSVLKRFPIF